MRRALLLFAVFLLACAFPTPPARAQFAACDHDYVATFDVPAIAGDPSWSAGTIECVEFFRFQFETPHGTRWVRGVGDVNVDTMIVPGGVDAIREGARRAVARLPDLGDYKINNVTILIAFSTAEHLEEPPEARTVAWTLPGVADGVPECHVTFFMLNDWSVDSEVPHGVAHEMFHCVQDATLTEAQNLTKSGGGLWWSEGSAELFAAAAIGSPTRFNRAAQFNGAVADGVPLTRLSYAAAVFFYWRYQNEGLGFLIPFLMRMSTDGSADAQDAALRSTMSEEQMLDFAEAYDDSRISYPGGSALNFGAQVDGETWRIDSTSTHRATLEPFVIRVGWAEYACGRWGNALNDANVAARSGPAWADWPSETDGRGGGARYRTVAIHTGDEAGELRLRAERREACTACMAASVIDRCLVGRWRQSGGGPVEYLRARGIPFTHTNVDPLVLTMNDDGTFQTGGANLDVGTRTVDSHGHVMESESQGRVQASFGRWSADGGRISGCFDGGGSGSGTTRSSAAGYTITTPFSSPDVGGTSGGTSYTCSATTFTTSQPTRYGPMTYTFTRETPPPPE